ncbi:MAG: hypothetical protein ACLGSD_00005 [Acidobacteriota bacterium]
MTSLFHEQPRARRGFSGLALSCLLHAASMGLVVYVVLYAPRIETRIIAERYSVRHLQLNSPDAPDLAGADGSIQYPGKNAGKASLDSLLAGDSSNQPEQVPPQPPQTATGLGGKQTLLQPAFHLRESFAVETPIPTVAMWEPDPVLPKLIVAPRPAAPTASTQKPSLDAPNRELHLADQAVAASPADPKLPAPQPATSSPVVTQVPAQIEMAPATVSVTQLQPTPTSLLSLSDLRMPHGSITVPPVNETKAKSNAAQVAPAAAKGPGTAKLPGTSQEAKVVLPNAQPAAAGGGDGKTLQAPPSAGVNPPDPPGTQHIVLPRDGKFSVVVVGTSLADEYPETLQVWNQRTAYTAYLHVGLSRNWILQYAQVRSADAETQGSGGRIEAPWPYDIFRPNLIAHDLNADALMVHGVVDEKGHFENLAVAFPADFDRATLVLHALQRWQFRPAQQNGKATSVEVLLIIPDEWE